jgi:cytochrome P450
MFLHGINQNPKHWDSPKVFNPDRFLEPNSGNIERHSFAMFGGGVRICPGRQLAMINLKTIIAIIFRKYDPELATPETKPKCTNEIVNRCHELMLKFKPRQ